MEGDAGGGVAGAVDGLAYKHAAVVSVLQLHFGAHSAAHLIKKLFFIEEKANYFEEII